MSMAAEGQSCFIADAGQCAAWHEDTLLERQHGTGSNVRNIHAEKLAANHGKNRAWSLQIQRRDTTTAQEASN